MNKLNNTIIRYFDVFAGVGGFRAGLDRAGGYECVGHCEIDKYADAAYRRLHKIKKNEVFYNDARQIDTDTLPGFELLTAGFPCQAFSMAGKRKGFADPRGNLFFDLTRVVESRKPQYLLFENVPGLLTQNQGWAFKAMLDELHRLRYHVEWQIINSKDFGVPQSRRRVYIIGYSNPECAGQILPILGANAKTPVQIVGGMQGYRVYDPAGLAVTQIAKAGGVGAKTGLYLVEKPKLQIKSGTKRGYQVAVSGDSVDLGFANFNTRRGRVGSGIAHTLDTTNSQGVITASGRIRRLMPRECFRLQGFTDSQIDKLLEGSSDTQAYKQAGNAVTVNVVEALAKRLKCAHEAIMAIPTAHTGLEAA